MTEITDRVRKKLEQTFPDASTRRAAEEAMRAYLARGTCFEPERVALAILKLSDDDHAQLLQVITAALSDYRDVLAWAEFPEQMRLSHGADRKALHAAQRRDREQYLRWLVGKK
jgi:hypothetical protein